MSNKLAGKCHRDDSCAVDIGDDREIDHRHGKSGEHWDVLQLVGDPKNSAPWVAPRRDMAALSAVLADIGRAGGCACQVTGDATKFSDIEAMRRQIEREFGPIDILVANAGGSFTKPGPMEETTEEGWRASIDGNLTATFLTIKSVLPGMKERRAGNIITISSAAARKPYHAAPIPYAAAKAGIQILTQDLAAQVGQYGIRANCIAPETILTERNRQLIPAVQQKALLESHPVRRLGTPEDVASAALYLASDEAAWIAGIILDVAGGAIMV